MVKKLFLVLLVVLLLGVDLRSQEVLLPLQTGPVTVLPSLKSDPQPLSLPFFDDFSGCQMAVSGDRWQLLGGVTVSYGGRLLPPTVGVATFDAIGIDGRLYDDASSGRFPADTLCSRPIDLSGLSADDSVVLSFYYLPGGGQGDLWRRIGDVPEAGDSLILDFYRVADSTWVTVWARGGVDVDSLRAYTGRDWQYVALPLADSSFFNDKFAFRFRNYCSMASSAKPGLAGNCDFWHLDYVLLDRGRVATATPEFRDVAFVNPAPSMLATYRAMPIRQYRQTDMADSLAVTITNLFSSALATQYRYAVVDAVGDTLHRYDGGYENAPPFLPDGTYQEARPHAAPSVGYAFPEGTTPATYSVIHMVREGVGGDIHQGNDTVRFSQVFDNYYAYDDGTAENGYGLTSTASRLYLACRFDLNIEDTLTALDLYFNRTLQGENETVPFNIMVWRNEDGKPGEVLYRDVTSRRPLFDGLDTYSRFMLERAVVVDGSVFVGFEQGNNYFINLGFDRNNDASDRIFYLTGTEWQQSILSGALMLRPCFGVSATVGITERRTETADLSVFPNPASEWVWVEGIPTDGVLTLFDMMGRQVATGKEGLIKVGGLADGVYMLRCHNRQGTIGIKKIIIKH